MATTTAEFFSLNCLAGTGADTLHLTRHARGKTFKTVRLFDPFAEPSERGSVESKRMYYLYGSKKDVPRRLVATFDSEPQLLAYVRWATLESHGKQSGRYEQGSALAGCKSWESSTEPLTDEDPSAVDHNPTPSML